VPRSASALECQAAQLVSDVLVRSSPTLPGSGPAAPAGQGGRQQHNFNSGQLSAAEAPLVALQELYGQAAQLSVQPLRHPKLMQLLLSGGPAGEGAQLCTGRHRMLLLGEGGFQGPHSKKRWRLLLPQGCGNTARLLVSTNDIQLMGCTTRWTMLFGCVPFWFVPGTPASSHGQVPVSLHSMPCTAVSPALLPARHVCGF